MKNFRYMTGKDRILTFVAVVAALALLAYIILSLILRPKVEPSSFVGTYFATVDGKRPLHCLELRDDGTYTHTFMGPDNQKVENSGTWQLEAEYLYGKGRPTVVFRNFVTGVPQLDEISGGKGFFGMTVERPLFGPLKLIVFWDLDYYFKKRKLW